MTVEGLQEGLFSGATQFRNNRRSKKTLLRPVGRHKKYDTLCFNANRHKLAGVESQVAASDIGKKRPVESIPTSAQVAFSRFAAHDGDLEVRMCRKLCEDGEIGDAVDSLNLLVQREYRVPSSLFYRVLKRCIANKDLALGKRIHALTVKNGYEGHNFLATHLIGLYASNGRLEDAMRVFTKVSIPDPYNWATIIFAYARHGEPTEAIRLYRQMRESTVQPDSHIFSAVLKACATAGDLAAGKDVHACVLACKGKPDIVVQTCLVDMYAKCGSIEDAREVFDKLPHKNVVTWTAMIAGYAQQGRGLEALSLYSGMQEEAITPPDCVTFVCLLQACLSVGAAALDQGKQLHAQIEERGLQDDVVVGSSLVNMYAKCGTIQDARKVFDRLRHRNVVTWTTMIAGYAQQGMGQEALVLYTNMQQERVSPPDRVTFVCLLQACATMAALPLGMQLHAQIAQRGLEGDVVVGASLVNMYSKCGRIEDARRLFDRLSHKNVVTWNAMIAGYTQQGMGEEALSLYGTMQREAVSQPDSVTYACLLQACITVGVAALPEGKRLHAEVEHRGLQHDAVVGASLVNMYAKWGNIRDAKRVFDSLPHRDVVAWAAMIAGYARQGMVQEALGLYSSMRQEGIAPLDPATFVSLLQACATVVALPLGQELHAEIEKRGLQDDVVLGASLVNMYAKCGSIKEARRVFDRLPEKDVVTWNVMIAGYTQLGMGQEGLSLYRSMQQEGINPPGSVTYVCLLQACASLGLPALRQGKQLHVQIQEQGLQNDVAIGASLVNMYAKCGRIVDARRVFDRLPHRNVVTWSAMITGYARQGMGNEALCLYSTMQRESIVPPDCIIFVCLLQACSSLGVVALQQGKQLHSQIEERGLQDDVVVGASLVNMYAKCGSIQDARRVFDRLRHRNLVTWTAMIAGYSQLEMGQEALDLYSIMVEECRTPPDSVTFVCLLQACASIGEAALHQGEQLHAQIVERGLQSDVVVGGTLVSMYANCGRIEVAQSVFDRLPHRNVETWNAMIAGYAQQGMGQEALDLYTSMQNEGITPDSISLVCLLQACATAAALPLGKQLHVLIEKLGLQADVAVGNGLVNMYAKCGSMVEAQQVFDSLPEREITAWGALTAGYTRQGDSAAVFHLVDRMREQGVQPDSITILSVLTVCSHVGLVDKGRKYFEAMRTEYFISPTIEHYTCMIDLLGRAGHLDEALQMAKTIPFPPDAAVWLTLLAACRKWNNVEIGQQAFGFAVRLDEKGASSYILMSNIYASAGMLDEAKEMQAKRLKFKAWKQPGQSWWTDMDGEVHTFVAGDKKHDASWC